MTLPDILTIQRNGNEVRIELKISHDLQVFEGHFPGEPVLPGVVQIDWVMQFAARHLGISTPAARDFKVKFTSIIRPDAPLTLTLNYDAVKAHLAFSYTSNGETMSAGLVRQVRVA